VCCCCFCCQPKSYTICVGFLINVAAGGGGGGGAVTFANTPSRLVAAAVSNYAFLLLLLLRLQEGVFRTNCVDCLDRTNVFQGLLARHALQDLLQELGVLAPGEELATLLPKVGGFKNAWITEPPECFISWCLCGQGVLPQGGGGNLTTLLPHTGGFLEGLSWPVL
jgi:hypothetical protein